MRIAIVGSGRVGRAVCRELAAAGDQVTVLSPNPVGLPALWLRCDAVTGSGLRAGLEEAEVVIYAASSSLPRVVKDVVEIGSVHAAKAAEEAGA